MAPDYSIIGKRIKKYRIERGMKQEELADCLDVSVAYMSRVERGTSGINLKRLIQIAEILNVSLSYLLNGSSIGSKTYLKEDFSDILDKCTPEQQKLIYKIAELVCNMEIVSKQ